MNNFGTMPTHYYTNAVYSYHAGKPVDMVSDSKGLERVKIRVSVQLSYWAI